MKSRLIKVQNEDNVAIALVDLWQGDTVEFEGEEVFILSDTQAKHKISMVDLAPGDKIYMYGVLVGKATEEIKRGRRNFKRKAKAKEVRKNKERK